MTDQTAECSFCSWCLAEIRATRRAFVAWSGAPGVDPMPLEYCSRECVAADAAEEAEANAYADARHPMYRVAEEDAHAACEAWRSDVARKAVRLDADGSPDLAETLRELLR